MQIVTLDFETYYAPKYSLTKLTTMEYVNHDLFKVWGVGIKIDTGDTEWYGEDDVENAIGEIDWEDTSLICHNTMFDAYILTQHYKVQPRFYFDTAAMSRGLYPGQSARLKDCAMRAFPDDETMRKGEELSSAKGVYTLDPELEETIASYCIQDVDLTYALFYHYLLEMPQSEIDLIDMTCKMFVEPKIKIDRERLTKYHGQEFTKAEKTIAAAGIDRKVLSSNQQFAEHIYKMGLVPPTKISPTTGEEIPALGKNDKAFTQMQHMYPQFEHIWHARIAIKSRLTETRSKRFLDAAWNDDWLPVPLRYYAAHTGRFGGTDKLNMQNLPRGGELRKCIVAADGKLLFVADLSNIEARMLAWLAGEIDLLQQFRNGEDIYSNLASEIYGRPINKTDDPVERFVGKVAVLGLGYGMGHRKFKDTLAAGAMGPAVNFTDAEAKKVVDAYRAVYPKIPTLWHKLEDLLKQTMHADNFGNVYGPLTVAQHALELPNKMSLKYHNLRYGSDGMVYDGRGSKTEYTYGGRITENVVQALSRIIVTDSMLRLNRSNIGDVVLTVHDEIIISGSTNNADDTIKFIIDDMCIPPVWALDIPLDAEGGYDKSYSK